MNIAERIGITYQAQIRKLTCGADRLCPKPLRPLLSTFDNAAHRGAIDGAQWPRLLTQTIDLERCLMAGEDGIECLQWAEMTSDFSRASKRLADSPHVKFLREYQRSGDAILRREAFKNTDYCKNADHCVRLQGNYFYQNTLDGLIQQARTFVSLYESIKRGESAPAQESGAHKHSPANSLPIVRASLTPGTVQIVDGQHRLAIAYACGRKTTNAIVLSPTPTPLQRLVLNVDQTVGRRELYQDIDGVEFDESWHVVRRCRPRFALMRDFLEQNGFDIPRISVLDMPCSYGWFVSEFAKHGADALGVERDPTALKIGRIAYGLENSRVRVGSIEAFLSDCERTFDVVLFLSVLHHYAMGRQSTSPEHILSRVARVTGSCMFLDTGENHEAWFRKELPMWTPRFIAEFIKKHTGFRHVVPLGQDQDNRTIYSDNYGRTLFACLR
jgi:2-polyprenyl-3-methyl-5-hydroxy-6-metoxy-1,4-benzoquinol methylase